MYFTNVFYLVKKDNQQRAFGSELYRHDSCGHEPALPASSTGAPLFKFHGCCLVFFRFAASLFSSAHSAEFLVLAGGGLELTEGPERQQADDLHMVG